jgi:hypothetical protein
VGKKADIIGTVFSGSIPRLKNSGLILLETLALLIKIWLNE